MVRQATKKFEQSHLVARPLVQFRPIFEGIEFSQKHSNEAIEITAAYNQLIKSALVLDEIAKKGSVPTLIATSLASGKQIEITNLLKFDPADSSVWSEKSLDIKLYSNDNKSLPNTLKAVVVTNNDGNPSYQTIGVVSESSVKEHNLKPGIFLEQASIKLTPGATSNQVKAKFQSATQYLESVRQNTPEHEQLPLAAAIWHVNHTRTGDKDSQKKASVAFMAFPDLLVKQLSDLQFTNLKVVGVHQPSNELRGRKWNQGLVQCALAVENNPDSPICGRRVVTVEGKTFAPLGNESPVLPIGTQFEAEIVSAPAAVVATTPKGNSLKIIKSEEHDFSDYQWNGENNLIEIGFMPNPNSASSATQEPMIPIAKIGDRVLGEFDSESVKKLTNAKILKPGITLTTSLQTTLGTTAQIKVDAQSLLYPYQQELRELREKIVQTDSLSVILSDSAPSAESAPSASEIAPSAEKAAPSQWPTANKIPAPENWMSVAQAIGRSPEYVDRVMMVTQPGLPLSDRANAAMQQDFSKWQQESATLQQWFAAAATIGKPPSYLERISNVARAYLSEQQPTPLSPEVFTAIQRDFSAHETLKQMEVGQSLSDSELDASSQDVQKKTDLNLSLMESEERAICIAAEIMLSMVGVRSDNGDITFSSDNYSFKQQFTEKGSKISIQANIDAHLVMSNGKLTSSVLPEDIEAMQLLQNTAAEIVEEKENLKKKISLKL